MRSLLASSLVLVLGACADDAAPAQTTTTDVTNATDAADATTDATVADVADVADVGPEPTTGTIGGDRPAQVILPTAYDPSTRWPLVLLLHGYGANGALQDLYLGFSGDAAAAGFITVIADGTLDGEGQRFWNASPGWCCDFAGSGVDDDGYLVGLVAEARAKWSVDPARVFAFGHSNGGFMAHALACNHADLFAGVGSLAGSLPARAGDCSPSEPVSVLQVHGTLDSTIVYPGNADYPGATTIAQRWAGYDACPGEAAAGPGHDYDSGVPGAEATPSTWSGCGQGSAVALWTLTGSGHIPNVLGSTFVRDALAWLDAHPKPAP